MLTKTNPDGTWSCQDIDYKELPVNVYAALCRLHDYEKSGFEPEELDKVKENVHIGSDINGYIVFGVWDDYCIAENPNAPDPYVTWKIDSNGFSVRAGHYFGSCSEAERDFYLRTICAEPNKTVYWKR